MLNEKKQKERGIEAMRKVVGEKEVQQFEEEMKKAQVREGLAKIEQLRKAQRENPGCVELDEQAVGGKTLVLQQKTKERNKRLEAEFEKQFIVPDRLASKQQVAPSAPPMPEKPWRRKPTKASTAKTTKDESLITVEQDD